MAKSFMAAAVDVKFPDEEYGGGSEEEDLVFWILLKIRDQVFRAVLDTGATLSIVAGRLLKTFNKTNDAFPWGAWPQDAAADTRKQAGRQSTALTRASSCSCHVTKRFRILATLKQGNKSMYSNTSGYVHMGLRLD